MHLGRLALFAALLLVGGCREDAPEIPQPLEGRVVQVHFESGSVASFRVSAGEVEHDILIDPAHDYGFDLEHLREHQETGDPVQVRWDDRDGRPYALSIEDA